MAKHKNLDVLRLLIESGGRNAKDPAQKEVDKGQQHGARCYWLSPQRANREFVHPQASSEPRTGQHGTSWDGHEKRYLRVVGDFLRSL